MLLAKMVELTQMLMIKFHTIHTPNKNIFCALIIMLAFASNTTVNKTLAK